MTLTEKNNILFRLGQILKSIGDNKSWPGYDLGINQDEYQNFDGLVKSVHIHNGWFKEAEVRKALSGISNWLTLKQLENWESNYPIKEDSSKRIAIIMAGNIPLVGFHDFISVFLSGNKALVKMSSEDRHLFPAILKLMSLFDERIWNEVELHDEKLADFDAVIATGSDNSSRYFESYFGKYPNIIRKNRTSLALLTGNETKKDLHSLGHDIFDFYGLGCRNISQMWIPENFDLNVFFEGIYDYHPIINHNKYANNYDYNKAVFLMNEQVLLDNGFLLLKEDDALHSPLAVLHYQRYKSIEQFKRFVSSHTEQIQCIVGEGYLPFGSAQTPSIDDYADGVDTMKFLTSL